MEIFSQERTFEPMDRLTTILCAVFASSGFWTLIVALITTKQARKRKETASEEAVRKLLLGLGHDRLYNLCEYYIGRGYITPDEYDNLTYIYKPYKDAGGNGTGDRLFEAVCNLPMQAQSSAERN